MFLKEPSCRIRTSRRIIVITAVELTQMDQDLPGQDHEAHAGSTAATAAEKRSLVSKGPRGAIRRLRVSLIISIINRHTRQPLNQDNAKTRQPRRYRRNASHPHAYVLPSPRCRTSRTHASRCGTRPPGSHARFGVRAASRSVHADCVCDCGCPTTALHLVAGTSLGR